jgi:hypothetical protein
LNIWAILGIPGDSDRAAIRRAYATGLRVTNPEDDPEGFKRLRAAYEAALRHLDYAATWSEDDDDDEAANDAESDWSQPRPEAAADAPQQQAVPEEPEIVAALAAREAELAALRTAMANLETGLRGPWRPADGVLEDRLYAILRSPALGEIRIRTDVEPWLAALLASTIPHSDAVLLQSIQAFGWNSGDHRRGVDRAIAVVLDRLDEWRLIESLNRTGHVHHAAWRSLTRPPGGWWSWRIAAFKPGMVGGVEIFLGIRGQVARGLHYSYRKESVERWQRFLARPRMTLGILALMPLAFLGLLWLGTILSGAGIISTAVIAVTGVIAFATPFAALTFLSRWRQRFQERAIHRRWLTEGWFAAYAALAFVTMALPPPYWPTFIVVPAIGIAIWAYIVVPPAEPGSLRLGGGAVLCAGAATPLLFVSAQFDPAEGFALAVMACLVAYLRLALWSAVSVTLGRLFGRHREWFVLGGTAAGLAVASAAFQLRAAWYPVMPVYPIALAAAALLPLVGPLPGGATGPSRAIARTMLILAFLAGLGASIPADRIAKPTSDVPMAMAPTDDARADAGMAMLEHAQPGFAQLRQGNPPLYAQVRAVMQRFYGNQIRRDEADRAIAGLIDQAYLAALPRADSGLLVEGLRIRLERLQSLRATAPASCASGDSEKEGPAFPEALRDRKRMEIFNIVSSPPETVTTGRIISGARVTARAAAAEHVDPATLLDRLEGHKGVNAACAARIAVTQALLDSDSVDDIAATLRDQYRRARPPKSSRPCRREDAQPLRPC